MNFTTLSTSALALLLTAIVPLAARADATPSTMIPPISATSTTAKIVAAADSFLGLLTAEQRAQVSFPFSPQKAASLATFARSASGGGGGDQRRPTTPGASEPMNPSPPRQGQRGPGTGPAGGFVGERYGEAVWSNYPVSDVPRPGLPLGKLTAVQRTAAMQLLQSVLSAKGYQKVLEIMGSDQALADAGTNYASGQDVYTLGIFGPPSAVSPWMIQFGGHHLGLNVTMAGERGAMTPTLTGAQPAVYTVNGQTVRALAQENDQAFALLDSLNASQRTTAILNYQINDLVLGPGHDGEVIVPEGLKGSEMTDAQRARLFDLISEWAGIVNDSFTATRLAEIRAGLGETYFAWSGPTTHAAGRNGRAYYRIQGPKVVIEFSPQGVGGDPTQHVHTIYRDPTNNYGRADRGE